MNNNERLINNVKEWIDIDNQIKMLRKEIKSRNEKKKELSNQLVLLMKENNIDNLDIGDNGQLIRSTRKTKQAISKKLLVTSLLTFFKDDKDLVSKLGTFILDSRKTKVTENIRRKITN